MDLTFDHEDQGNNLLSTVDYVGAHVKINSIW